MIKLSKLVPNPNNPRYITKPELEKLKRSLESFKKMMYARPIVTDENNVILGGNMRYRALDALGYKEIPDEWVYQYTDLTEEEKREFVIKDNAGFGEWDYEELANNWDDLPLSDWGVDVPDNNNLGNFEEKDNTKQTKSTCPTCGQNIDNDVPF